MAFVSQKCVFSIAREISKDSSSRVERENETSTLVLLYTEEEKQYFHYLSIKITLMKLFFPLSWISQIYNDDDLKTQKVDLLRWNIILVTWKQLKINFKNSSWFGVFLFWIYYRFMACFIFLNFFFNTCSFVLETQCWKRDRHLPNELAEWWIN